MKIDADDWRMIDLDMKRWNVYGGSEGVQDILTAHRKEKEVTIYTHDTQGTGEFSFIAGDDIEKQIANALVISKKIRNESYTLPEGRRHYNTHLPLADAVMKEGVERKLQQIAKKMIQRLPVNTLEIHASRKRVCIKNSKGINARSESTAIYILLITSRKGEYVYFDTFSRLQDMKIEKLIEHCKRYLADIDKAKPARSFAGKTVLKARALAEFFRPHLGLAPMVGHASARLAHMGLSRYRRGESIVDAKAEPLTLISNPAVPYNPASGMFDEDGIPSKIVTLVDRGVFQNHFANNRYAQYLDIKPTGALGVIQVGRGAKGVDELSKGEHVEIHEFASFCPNMISGDFSAEIRLGYRCRGKNRTPFRGGMFTGNVFELLREVHFSKESMTAEGYLGPKAIRFMHGTIAGMEKT